MIVRKMIIIFKLIKNRIMYFYNLIRMRINNVKLKKVLHQLFNLDDMDADYHEYLIANYTNVLKDDIFIMYGIPENKIDVSVEETSNEVKFIASFSLDNKCTSEIVDICPLNK